MFDIFKNRLELIGILTTVTALRISSGRSTEAIGSDLPVTKDAFGRPLIPGSSFKGALRSRLESFLRAINPDFAANPAIEAEWSILSKTIKNEQGVIIKEGIDQLKEDTEKELEEDPYKVFKLDELLTQKILAKTDLVSCLFGSPWLASKFQVRDLTVVPEFWFGQYQERDGVAINRDTETAADGKLYDYQVVPAGTPFYFKAVVENAEDWELGLLMIGLHQFETEQIPLGGGRSRGLGVVRLEIDKMRWIDVEDNPQFLLEYLRKLVMEDETAYEDARDYKDEWVRKLIEHLNNKISPQTTAESV
ncbi:type III CRISPR-associated RAMP protein Csx7 [Iningainema tapete]|uniref:CRISPR-associated RAMP protein n=1 Tax=Iningainema tapete BLCC-T55 TaxID=2748662 RepID=A0A8J6XRT4_9CYAN|nr:CRISPR-associated RAMP protein Csx7 [Iningainema tapete]MBD2775417.1 CRISPR-associated RAMP protein [Iningainema tapete BLCC-T55]